MLHLWVIALFAGLVLRDSLKEPLLDGRLSDAMIAGVTIGAMLLIGGVTHAIVAVCGSRLRTRGNPRDLMIAEAALGAARWTAVVAHLTAILVLGWADAIRRVLGDIIALDEIIAMLPPLFVFAWGWWAVWPIERDLRGVSIVRQLDTGGTIYPIPGRLQFVILNLRHHVLVWLTPLVLILAWSESAQRLTLFFADRGTIPALRDDDVRVMVDAGMEFAGVIVVFLVLGPLAMRYVWDTMRMPPGPLRDRLLSLCRRHRVRISEVLVWRTHGTMINGAVLGLTPAFRYVLLTDALLDSLPDEQVEAVMAHEVAHVRHRHIIWLGVVLLATLSGFAWVAEFALRNLSLVKGDDDLPAWLALGISGLSFAAAMLVFGVVSRRFEWQADAFAAAHMSDSLRTLGAPDASFAVTHDGANAMQGALRAVADLNHVPVDRPSWRHGSIGVRLERLARLIGTPEPRFPINSTARAIKVGALAAIALLLGAAAVQFFFGA